MICFKIVYKSILEEDNEPAGMRACVVEKLKLLKNQLSLTNRAMLSLASCG